MRARTGFEGRTSALGLALAAIFASSAASAANVALTSGYIGVSPRPPGVAGGINEINHVSAGSGGTDSQALVIGFGAEVYDVSFRPGAFQINDGGNPGCSEAGRWTAFNGAGQEVGTGVFVAGTPGINPVNVGPEPISFIAFNAETYVAAPVCTLNNPADNSDFTIDELRYALADGDPQLVVSGGNDLETLDSDNFYAYDPGQDFQDGDGNLITPLGARLGQVVIILDPAGCSGGATGDGTGEDCTIDYGNGELTSFIEDAGDIVGELRVADIVNVDDTRACVDAATNGALVLDGTGGLPALPTDGAGGFLTVPPHLCGIPPDDGEPRQLTVVVLETEVEISRSVISHLVESPETADGETYACKDPVLSLADRSTQPVIGWKPRFSAEFPEVPVTDATGAVVNELEDVTNGPCGSYRGSTGRWSYIIYDLAHIDGADINGIVADELAQLSATFGQAVSCGSPFSSTLNNEADQLAEASLEFAAGSYAKAQQVLGRIARDLDRPKSPLFKAFAAIEDCYYSFSSGNVFYLDPDSGAEPGPGEVFRNFPGDFRSQLLHINYMLEYFLGEAPIAYPFIAE